MREGEERWGPRYCLRRRVVMSICAGSARLVPVQRGPARPGSIRLAWGDLKLSSVNCDDADYFFARSGACPVLDLAPGLNRLDNDNDAI